MSMFYLLKSLGLGSALASFFVLSSACKACCQDQVERGESYVEQFVQVGHHQLFVSMHGSSGARFTVVFESGAGGTSQDWRKVRAMLPAGVRTIAYDRAGLGRSEPGPLPQTMAQSVFELHELLRAMKITRPVILVGQSVGGLLVRLYTDHYGTGVAGMILVDPTHENAVLGSLRYGGWVRLREKATGKRIPQPQVQDSISPGYDSTADYMAEEFQKMHLSSMKNPQALGDRPLIVLGAGTRKQPPGTPDDQWKILRAERDQQVKELAQLSANSTFVLDPKSSHSIQNDDPAIVAASIRMIIHSISSDTNLKNLDIKP